MQPSNAVIYDVMQSSWASLKFQESLISDNSFATYCKTWWSQINLNDSEVFSSKQNPPRCSILFLVNCPVNEANFVPPFVSQLAHNWPTIDKGWFAKEARAGNQPPHQSKKFSKRDMLQKPRDRVPPGNSLHNPLWRHFDVFDDILKWVTWPLFHKHYLLLKGC